MGWRWCDGFPQLQGGGGVPLIMGFPELSSGVKCTLQGQQLSNLWGSEFPGARFVGCELTAWLRCASFFAFIGRYVAFYRIFRILPLPEGAELMESRWLRLWPRLRPSEVDSDSGYKTDFQLDHDHHYRGTARRPPHTRWTTRTGPG